MDAMVEASRVFGNFSRFRGVRALLAEHKGNEWTSGVLLNYIHTGRLILSGGKGGRGRGRRGRERSPGERGVGKGERKEGERKEEEGEETGGRRSGGGGGRGRGREDETVGQLVVCSFCHVVCSQSGFPGPLVDEIMIALLDAGERDTVFTACGVLINLMTDANIRPKLKEEEGVKK